MMHVHNSTPPPPGVHINQHETKTDRDRDREEELCHPYTMVLDTCTIYSYSPTRCTGIDWKLDQQQGQRSNRLKTKHCTVQFLERDQ